MKSRALITVVLSITFLFSANMVSAGLIISSISEVGGDATAHITGDSFTHSNSAVGAYTVPTFGEDVVAYSDRDHQWNGDNSTGLPTFLVGGDYVMTANDARDNNPYQLNVTLAQPAYLYSFRDNRDMDPSDIPAWYSDGVGLDMIQTWAIVGNDNNGVSDGTNGPGVGINDHMTVFMAVDTTSGNSLLSSGTYQLLESDTGAHGMYGVVASTQSALPDAMDDTQSFDIYVDIGPENQRVESGHIGVPNPSLGTTPDSGDNGVEPIGIPIDTGTGTFLMSISNADTLGNDQGGIDWRDRGTSSSTETLVQLGEDFIKNNSGIINLKFDNLPEGEYEITSFHIDPGYDQSDLIDVSVDVGDGNGFVDVVGLGEEGSAGTNYGINSLTEAALLGSSTTFSFIADGIHPVSIVFDGTGSGDNETPLNGFRMIYTANPVPEPATFIFGALGLLGVCLIGRRRRK